MQPLADMIRPTNLEDFIGQHQLVNQNGPIFKMIETNNIFSHIYWGPPASGKTTLAKIIANTTEALFVQLSAVTDGKSNLMKIISSAKENSLFQKITILFIDEIHRWNKAQQDTLLPFVEDGTIILIGATTENPSFTINNSLLSRTRVFVLQKPTKQEVQKSIERGLKKINRQMSTKSQKYLAKLSDGDIRFALNTLEILNSLGDFSIKNIDIAAQKSLNYDRDGEEHYNIISAVHKSLRSSNATAGVYWVCRMLNAGEDPLYIARRLLRFASEDIGNANPNALLLANQVYEAIQKVGMPEAEIFFSAACSISS
ncbi:MAG: replication-associated recombination protein A [Thermales bacterium]|nr:replication-associated recombination protein A [Thermales bacterium]